MRHRQVAAVIAFIAVIGLIDRARADADAYTINWGTALSAAQFPAESVYNPSNVDLGTCVCDLTEGSCDNNCYCDPNCVSQDTSAFSYALTEQPKAYSVAHCVDANLVEVNARGGLAYTVVDNVLCVSKDNNPSQGSFYTAPTTDAAQLATLIEQTRVSRTYQPVTSADPHTLASVNSYMPGDQLRVLRYDAGDSYAAFANGAFGGRLVLPSPGVGGVCNDNAGVKYGEDVDNRRCVRVSNDLATDCATRGLFSASRYVQNLYLQTTYSGGSRIPLRVTYIRAYDGTVTNPPFNDTAAYEGPIAEPTYNSTGGCSCNNALLDVTFHLTRSLGLQSGGTEVSDAYAVVTLGIAPGLLDTASQKCYGGVTQSFSVFWNSTASLSQGNIIARSGNPGYLFAKPVLFGTKETQISSSATTLEAIQQFKDGFWGLRSDANGYCQPADGTMPDEELGLRAEQLRFGEDMHTSCVLPLNYAELQAKCTAGVLGLFNISDRAMFGSYGNSPFMQPWQWTALTQPAVTLTNTFFAAASKCTAYNIFNLEILYAPTGAVGNEQYKILTARLVVAPSDWTYQHEREAASTVEHFPVRATVTWVPASDAAYSEFVPQPPNPFPKLDADILYPFYIPSAAPGRYGDRYGPLIASAIALAVAALAAVAVRP